ncbi:vesicle-associated membrane protein-associated protein A isoform X2 [Diaphorina citri]|uniref:Vesicle-associated membrane protein-associated protein A isoform X2 n=1 Tax=Diaphorina citri TaxID=121845 RepID=A0A1S3DCS1_DIACI|nr:vesicle-associated membrane protein-associated protein A isoform X2 [Diaphorina citri]
MNEKNKHKFMVQSISAPDGEVNVDSLWKEVEPSSISEYKLRCVFENPLENNDEGPENFGPVYPDERSRRIPEQTAGPDGELAKAAQEVTTSREEESALRQENLELKEELLRLRYGQHQSDQQDHQARDSDISLTMIVALAIFTAILGIALGKFVL